MLFLPKVTMKSSVESGYRLVNGIQMYFEMYGNGEPLVLIHGGGSTIQSTFGRIIPLLSSSFKLIAVELQAHGRTADRRVDSSFTQDADDVVELLYQLKIYKAYILGFSNGGTTALQIAIRHPLVVQKLILCSALSKRNGVPDWFWGMMMNASLDNMPKALQQAFLDVNPDASKLQIMYDRDAKRMVNFVDFPDDDIKGISSPTLIVCGDNDIVTIEHSIELRNLINNAQLAVIPGGHGDYIGEITTITDQTNPDEWIVPMIKKFLNTN